MSEKFEVKLSSIIADVLQNIPQSAEVFKKHNMPCIMCMGINTETIEGGALMHGIDPQTVLDELKALEQK